jgi:hypothetical protein
MQANDAHAKLGRKTMFSPEIAEAICERVAAGMPLIDVCDEMQIGQRTVFDWLKRKGEAFDTFRSLYARAREMQGEAAAAEALRLARTLVIAPDLDSARVGAARLLSDNLRWYAERLAGSVWADNRKQAVEVSGSFAVAAVTIDARSLAPEQRDALRAALIAAKGSQSEGSADIIDSTDYTEEQDD